MSRSAAVPVVLAVLCIVGIGMVSATVDSAQPVGGPGETDAPTEGEEGAVEEGGPPQDSPNFTDPGGRQERQQLEIATCVEPLNTALGAGAIALGFLAVVGLIYRRFNFSTALLSGWTILPPVVLVYFLATNCAEQGPDAGVQSGGGLPSAGASPVAPLADVPTWAIGLLIGGVLVAAVGLLYRSLGGDEVVDIEEEAVDDEPDLDQFAEAAGRAADRIEEHNADVDNAVYRAWVEMTDLLDVENPDTYAPGEFADRAIELGMDEDDVGRLTTLFNEVRYGGRDAETREDQAIDILRNIEAAYSAPDDDGVATDDPTDANDTEEDTDA